MKHAITIKDLIYFGAIAEAYSMKGLKLNWHWKYGCGCRGDTSLPTHTYSDCEFQDNLFWSERFTELGRTIKMALQQDEVEEVVCRLTVSEEETEQLRAISNEAEDLLGDVGMEYYDFFVQRADAERDRERLSVLEEHHFYTMAKDWYINNQITPIVYEEIKVNVCAKFLAKKLLNQLVHKREAVIEAIWTPTINEDEELLFHEHSVKISEQDHVTSNDATIKENN